ncbi:MAG: CoA transferase [Leifsonia sp.]
MVEDSMQENAAVRGGPRVGLLAGASVRPISGPLTGIRVADFSRVLAGPYATMMLADFGADVIKIESPAGDDTRQWRPPVDAQGDATYFGSVNRNKRGIVCDFTTEAGLAEASRLAASADVVIENFRPGVMAKFGLDYDSVRAVNPGVVYCSVTGFGSGAGAALPGYDLLVQAVGGLMSVTGQPEAEPSKVGVALVDVLTGQNALAGILLALRERDGSSAGEGRLVEVDLLTTLLAALTNQAAGTLASGVAPARLGNAHPSIAPYELFQASDRELVIAVGNDRQFRTLMRLLGAPDLAADDRFVSNSARVAHRTELRESINGLLAAQSAGHWADILTDAGVPAGLVNSIDEALAFAAGLGLEAVVDMRSGVEGTSADATDSAQPPRISRQVANPIHLSGLPAVYRLLPPRLGEHAGADWLDLSDSPTSEGTP